MPAPAPRTRQVQINVDLNGLRRALHVRLSQTISVASALLRCSEWIDCREAYLPVEIPFIIDQGNLLEIELLRKHSQEWILANAFRDAIEALTAPLEQAHEVLRIWKFLEEHGRLVPAKNWLKFSQIGTKQFHRSGLPEKLDTLARMGLELDEILRGHVQSINAARNCLVHRNGIIGASDINSFSSMKVSWRHLVMSKETADGDIKLRPGSTVEKGEIIKLQMIDTFREFPLGEQIVLSAEEIQAALWTLFLFVENLTAEMNKLGVDMGMLKSKVGGCE